jgi:rhodanese-related sulfurtransferase
MNQLEGRINEIPKDKDVVVVCASGSRSRMALDILRREGLEKSSSMSGGIRLWRQAGYPIEQGRLP